MIAFWSHDHEIFMKFLIIIIMHAYHLTIAQKKIIWQKKAECFKTLNICGFNILKIAFDVESNDKNNFGIFKK